MNKVSGIYKIQSLSKPERVYIGSAVNIDGRWRLHIHELKRNMHHSVKMQRHYNKYGRGDLQFALITSCDKKDLISMEQFYIDAYKPYFNCLSIAGSSLGYKHTDKTRLRLSVVRKGRTSNRKGVILSEESKNKMRLAKVGTISNAKGKKWTEESRAKMRGNKHGIGHKITEEARQRMKDGWVIRKQKK